MGGQAFDKPKEGEPKDFPRMPPELYHRVASHIKRLLELHFARVAIPREAPEKADHGDIDFLVAEERPQDLVRNMKVWDRVKAEIGAVLHKRNGSTHNFAIDHPDTFNALIQIDVELSPGHDTPEEGELFEWTNFMKSDSDLLQIIGICHRPLGLTCNDRGLHLRVEQVEPYNKKKSLIFLTRDPNTAMRFYGFNTETYWAGFRTEEELFNWVTQGRFFSREVFDRRVEKANDRARQAKRPMYRRFVEEYMPAYPEIGSKSYTRSEVLEAALETFGKREEYNDMLSKHYIREADVQLWKEIRGLVPLEGQSLGTALKGLKRWVNFEKGKYPERDVYETSRWIALHCKLVLFLLVELSIWLP